jgi:hypothetical protein
MFIVHGTTKLNAELGHVVDHCPLCDQACPFVVAEVRSVSHVYFIPIGKGVGGPATRKCLRCGAVYFCDPLSYERLLSQRDAKNCSADELLERTNPDLAAALERRARLQRDIQKSDAGEDTAQLLAMCELRDLRTRSRQVDEFQDRLLGWHHLSPEGRESLLGEIAAYAARVREEDRTSLFVGHVCRNAPEGAGCLQTILSGFLLGVFFIWLGVLFDSGAAGFGLFVAWSLTVCLAQYAFGQMTYHRWFTKRLIEPAEAAGLDPALVAQTLKELKKSKPGNPHVREMLNRTGLLDRLLQTRQESPPPG